MLELRSPCQPAALETNIHKKISFGTKQLDLLTEDQRDSLSPRLSSSNTSSGGHNLQRNRWSRQVYHTE